MAAGVELTRARMKFERAVMEALGYGSDDPVSFHALDPDEGMVTFFWCSPGEPPTPPHGNWTQVVLASNMYPRYTVHSSALRGDQWDAIMKARAEWVANFFTTTPLLDRA